MSKRRTLSVLGGLVCALVLLTTNALASTEFKAVCAVTTRVAPEFKTYEWFAQQAFERTNGRVKIEVQGLAELGFSGFDLARSLSRGLVDFGDVLPTYVSSDIPAIEGVVLPGLFEDWDITKKAHRSWHGVMKQYEKEMGGVFLGSTAYHNVYLYSHKPVEDLQKDLKGMRIRVFGTAQGTYVTKLGASAISLPMAEVYTALERGVVDGGITGSYGGYGLKWYEIVDYITDLQVGPTFGALVVGQRFWDKLPLDIKDILVELGPEFTERGFEVARKATIDGIENNRKAGMTWTPTKPEWRPVINDVVKTAIVPDWIKRSGPEAKEYFNKYLAPYVGFTIP